MIYNDMEEGKSKKISKRSLITFLVGMIFAVFGIWIENPILGIVIYVIAAILIIMSIVFQFKDKSLI